MALQNKVVVPKTEGLGEEQAAGCPNLCFTKQPINAAPLPADLSVSGFQLLCAPRTQQSFGGRPVSHGHTIGYGFGIVVEFAAFLFASLEGLNMAVS